VTAISEVATPSVSEVAPESAAEAPPRSARRSAALVLATMLLLGCSVVLGYTQWWVPREQARQVAQVKYDRCLEDVKVYRGKASYPDRLAQCQKFLAG
jgi:predicted negative regulator of RcsB-dependent stress response